MRLLDSRPASRSPAVTSARVANRSLKAWKRYDPLRPEETECVPSSSARALDPLDGSTRRLPPLRVMASSSLAAREGGTSPGFAAGPEAAHPMGANVRLPRSTAQPFETRAIKKAQRAVVALTRQHAILWMWSWRMRGLTTNQPSTPPCVAPTVNSAASHTCS